MTLRTGRWGKLLALLFSLSLLAAACGGNDDGDDAASNDGGDDKAQEEGGGEPKPGPGFDGTTITLGVVTPQTGVASVIGKPLTNGNQVFWDSLNEAGGIAGKYKVKLDVKDSLYQPQTGVQQYNAIKDQVVAFQQILGTNVVNAILPLLKTDQIVAGPASLDSFWIPEQQLMAIGAPYQVQAINAMDWWVNQEGNEDSKICLMRQNDPYGEAGKEGLEFAASEMDFEVTQEAVFAPTDTSFAGQVNQLKAAGCELVYLVGLPNATGGIMSAAEQSTFTPQWIGASPTWIPLLAGNKYMQEHFVLASEGPVWGDDTEGMKKLIADAQKYSPDQTPDTYFAFGYAQAWSLAQILERAVKLGDLSRAGIVEAMNTVGTLDTGGILGDYEYGEPSERKFPRAGRMFDVDAAAPGGLQALTDEFTSKAAEKFELE